MRVEGWNPNAMDQTFEDVAIERIVAAAQVVANAARQRCPVGTVSRPIYKRGPYAGQPWTSRDGGRLKRSIRVTRKLGKSGKPLSKKRNVRVYAGTYAGNPTAHEDAYYAAIVEYGGKSFLRRALEASMGQMKEIIGAR